MLRSLAIAVVTFVLLGSYYNRAWRAIDDPAIESRRVARRAALAGANRAREALADRWVDRRVSGVHEGGVYRALAVVRRDRGAISSTGVVEADGGRPLAEYGVRMVVERRIVGVEESDGGYTVAVDRTSPFIESS